MVAEADVAAIVRGTHGAPFSVLGMHASATALEVRAFLPQASQVTVIDARDGSAVAALTQLDPAGFFAGRIGTTRAPFPYRLRVRIGAGETEIDDPYRFGTILGDLDLHLIGEGTHHRLYDVLGAHPALFDGVAGVTFAVWAPNAKRVSVVGDFNDWDGRRHPMRLRGGSGVWELFVPAAHAGSLYKYELLASDGRLLPLKADPLAFAAERAPATASVVAVAAKDDWADQAWMASRGAANAREAPIAIYEVHLGSWRRAEGNRYLTYGELSEQLIPYVASLGFTHIELLPVTEFPFDGSWGYQPIGLYAPTSRFGTPAEFAGFVECAHQAGIGVLLDWVPGHFPTDAHGLAQFDGTHLYEHADPRQGLQPDWNTLVYNFGRNEVANFLIANALFWLERYHIDGIRVDAVASMLYLDYSRKAGEWIPNEFGGRENLAAIRFLQRCNELAFGLGAGATTIAEESTAFPKVSQPVYDGGLGFGYKWNMGWMHDTLAYLAGDPLFRSYHQDELTFSFMYAFSENFVLPFSHDEVVHGKGSLLGKMPGDDWARFANVRAAYGYMYGHPGKKLLFMGCEFAQEREWNHDRSLDWHLLDDPRHAGVQRLVKDLNAVYRWMPALHERDCESPGLEWIVTDPPAGVVAFARSAADGGLAIVVANFTPVVRSGYRLGVPAPGTYATVLNTDASIYGGSGVEPGTILSEEAGAHGKACSIVLTLPPLAVVFLRRI